MNESQYHQHYYFYHLPFFGDAPTPPWHWDEWRRRTVMTTFFGFGRTCKKCNDGGCCCCCFLNNVVVEEPLLRDDILLSIDTYLVSPLRTLRQFSSYLYPIPGCSVNRKWRCVAVVPVHDSNETRVYFVPVPTTWTTNTHISGENEHRMYIYK